MNDTPIINESNSHTILEWLHYIEKHIPADRLSARIPGFAFILACKDGPETISNLPSDLCRELVKFTAKLELDSTESFSATEH